MNFVKQTINFRKVVAGDTFDPKLPIDPAYSLVGVTSVKMNVKPYSDIPQAPILSFTTGESITIVGQKLIFNKPGEQMNIKPGKYQYDCQFTKGGIKTTLFGGLFEIISNSTQTTN
jgi:hypothetical protein